MVGVSIEVSKGEDDRIVEDFVVGFLGRMSRCYYDELLYFTATIPNPVINFNDVLLLKRGQKYIAHTNLDFQKSVSRLFCLLYDRRGRKCSVCKTEGGRGRGVYVNDLRCRFHFMTQEKFVNFPRVPWMAEFGNGDSSSTDCYVMMIKKDEKGLSFAKQANDLLSGKGIIGKSFVLLEDYVSRYFDDSVWSRLQKAFAEIEQKVKDYQWMRLIGCYNHLTQDKYNSQVIERLRNFDYQEVLRSQSRSFPSIDYALLKKAFSQGERLAVFLSDADFVSSFVTSEWLFDNLNGADSLEKTFVVSGYLKSVEQLLAYIIKRSAHENDQISVASSAVFSNVDILSDAFNKATLGNMVYHLRQRSSRHLFVGGLSGTAIRIVNAIVGEWVQHERNGYFHKHNIRSEQRVKEIRNKTYLLYFLILSALNVQSEG